VIGASRRYRRFDPFDLVTHDRASRVSQPYHRPTTAAPSIAARIGPLIPRQREACRFINTGTPQPRSGTRLHWAKRRHPARPGNAPPRHPLRNASISSGVRAAETLGLSTGAAALTALDEMTEMAEKRVRDESLQHSCSRRPKRKRAASTNSRASAHRSVLRRRVEPCLRVSRTRLTAARASAHSVPARGTRARRCDAHARETVLRHT